MVILKLCMGICSPPDIRKRLEEQAEALLAMGFTEAELRIVIANGPAYVAVRQKPEEQTND